MTLGSHQKTVGDSQSWITPKFIIDALGPFDLDPCAATVRPWDCARINFTEDLNGLEQRWLGNWFVFLNPPFHRYQVAQWIERMATHNHGIALLHARTETAWFKPIWQNAAALLFLNQRLTFHKPDGSLCTTAAGEPANSGAPVVLCAFGNTAEDRLAHCNLGGALVRTWNYSD